MKKAATKKKEGASKRGGRKAGSTPSSSKHDDAVVETETPTTQQTQPTQETQEAEEAAAKVGSMADSNQEKEDEEAEPGSLTEETQANQEAGEAARAKSPAIEEDPEKKQDDVETALPDSSSSQQEKEKKPVRRGRPQKVGGARRGKAASTSSPSKNDDAAAETATQPSQPSHESQPSQNAEYPVKVESLVIEDKEEAIPDSSSQQGASSSSQPKTEEEKEKEPLRRGKRKRSTKEETPPVPKAKRARETKPQEAATEPEYFKEKRSLEDLWKAAFPVGTEWGQLDALYDFEWDFTNVEEAFEEGGKLYGKKVYVFGCTESHLVTYKNENKTILVPAVVCVESSIPPSDKIGITSAESDAEEIIPMKDMKMAWVPYIPLEKRDRKVDRVNFQIFILGCTQRRSALKHLKEDRVKKFNCCLPYINNPFKEDETEQSTVVHINFPYEPPIVREYDWAIKDIEEFTNDLIVDEALHVDYKDEFNVFVKEQCDNATKAYEEAKQGRDKAKEEMSEETKEAYKEMKLYKFYPLPSPDLSVINKSSFINKYFGTAHEVV